MANANKLDANPYLNACPLCTHRPATVAVGHFTPDSETVVTTVYYRRGPQGKGRRVSLPWELLCAGCEQEIGRALDEQRDTRTVEEVLADAPCLVGLNWDAVVLGLRD